MKDRTANNVHTAFVEEAKAHERLLMFAKKAEEEELPQIAHLFRAVAAAEGIHSRRHFAMLESVADTQTNLKRSFQSENNLKTLSTASTILPWYEKPKKKAKPQCPWFSHKFGTLKRSTLTSTKEHSTI